jgi:hypothetical protein
MAFAVRRGTTSGWPPARKSGEQYNYSVEANPKGYNFQVRVSEAHEAEAKAAPMKKEPSRIGRLLLAMLGYRPRQSD